ncbi:MAG: short-chain dehydrogenase [Spongiibacteraceae bacterium]|jgi:meso-butanediol dehydrogenase / (S,S)-butanediol dehydrogenase / diacetyl reductase|nr:short-chain dehydrogenase [Spongiibacteraceae bacterium]
MGRFSGKTVLITGAASGIGRASAQAFAAEGASLYLCDINGEGLQAVADTLPGQVKTRVLDVTSSADCRAAVDEAVTEFGQLDVLCNIAGIAKTHHFHDTTDEQWDQLLAVNLSSVMYLSRAAIPHLLKQKGNIVNMASIAGLMGQAYTSGYCASKAAVVMLSKSIALEYAKQGLRCNAICPGGVQTELVQKFSAPEDVNFELMARYMPLTEMAEAEDVANAVLFLASQDARHINGVALPLDSGVSAG